MKSLVVEDDFTTRKMLQKLLLQYGDSDVAVDGAEALEVIQRAREEGAPYDLICLDIMLPKMDGREVLKSLRDAEVSGGIEGLEGVKVIMITGLSDKENILGSFREGCEGYLIKPISPDKLVNQLKSFELIS